MVCEDIVRPQNATVALEGSRLFFSPASLIVLQSVSRPFLAVPKSISVRSDFHSSGLCSPTTSMLELRMRRLLL